MRVSKASVNLLLRIARIAVSLGLLVIAAYILDWNAIGDALQQISVGRFAASVGVLVVLFLVLSHRWRLMVERVAQVPFRLHLGYYLYATFLNAFTPANIGGDIYRGVVLRRHKCALSDVLLLLIQERAVGLAAHFGCYVALMVAVRAFTVLPENQARSMDLLGVGCAVGLALILVLPRLWRDRDVTLGRRWLQQLARALNATANALRRLGEGSSVSLYVYSVIGLALWVLAVGIVGNAVGLELSWPILGLIVIAVELLRMIPISVQGIGLREGGFAYLAALCGGSPEAAFITAALAYLALSASLLVCGLGGWWLLLGRQPSDLGNEIKS